MMANRKSQKARPGFESLERRDTPGSLAGGGELASIAARAAITAAATTSVFRGAGIEKVTKQTPLANGALFVVGGVTGAATTLGTFKGINSTIFTRNLATFRSTAIFQATDGSRLVISITGVRGAGTSATGRYTITGGTRRFAGATGTG